MKKHTREIGKPLPFWNTFWHRNNPSLFGGPSNLNFPFWSTAVRHYMEKGKDDCWSLEGREAGWTESSFFSSIYRDRVQKHNLQETKVIEEMERVWNIYMSWQKLWFRNFLGGSSCDFAIEPCVVKYRHNMNLSKIRTSEIPLNSKKWVQTMNLDDLDV
jgi:hypothetical protein